MKNYILILLLAVSAAFVGCEEEEPFVIEEVIILTPGEKNAQKLKELTEEHNINHVIVEFYKLDDNGDPATYIKKVGTFRFEEQYIVVSDEVRDVYFDLNNLSAFYILTFSSGHKKLYLEFY